MERTYHSINRAIMLILVFSFVAIMRLSAFGAPEKSPEAKPQPVIVKQLLLDPSFTLFPGKTTTAMVNRNVSIPSAPNLETPEGRSIPGFFLAELQPSNSIKINGLETYGFRYRTLGKTSSATSQFLEVRDVLNCLNFLSVSNYNYEGALKVIFTLKNENLNENDWFLVESGDPVEIRYQSAGTYALAFDSLIVPNMEFAQPILFIASDVAFTSNNAIYSYAPIQTASSSEYVYLRFPTVFHVDTELLLNGMGRGAGKSKIFLMSGQDEFVQYRPQPVNAGAMALDTRNNTALLIISTDYIKLDQTAYNGIKLSANILLPDFSETSDGFHQLGFYWPSLRSVKVTDAFDDIYAEHGDIDVHWYEMTGAVDPKSVIKTEACRLSYFYYTSGTITKGSSVRNDTGLGMPPVIKRKLMGEVRELNLVEEKPTTETPSVITIIRAIPLELSKAGFFSFVIGNAQQVIQYSFPE